MLKDKFFWFAQPSSILNDYDWGAGYIFAGLIGLFILFWVVNKFAIKNPVLKKHVSRLGTAMLWVGILGGIWFGFRYEAVPLLSRRVVAGAIMLLGIIWFGILKWKFWTSFFKEKKEFEFEQVKNRYIPGSK